MLTPSHTYLALLIVQTLHLLHHRLAKRHISFTEVVSAAVLCFPPFLVALPALLFPCAASAATTKHRLRLKPTNATRTNPTIPTDSCDNAGIDPPITANNP